MPTAEPPAAPVEAEAHVSAADVTPDLAVPESKGVMADLMSKINKLNDPKEEKAEDSAKPPKVEKKPEAKKEEPAKTEEGHDDDAETKNMTPSAGARFKEIRTRAAAAEKQALEFRTKSEAAEARIKELETAGTQIAELEPLRAKISEYEKELSLTRVEATPEYKRTVIEPMARMIAISDEIAKAYDPEGKEGISEKILNMLEDQNPRSQAKKIAAFASEFEEYDRHKLYTLGQDYQRIAERRGEIKANAAEALKQIQERERADGEQMSAQQKQEWTRASGSTWDNLKSHFPDLPEADATRIRGAATSTDFNTESTDGRVFATYAAYLLPVALESNKGLKAKVAELEKRVAGFNKAKPGAGSGNGHDVDEKQQTEGGFLEAVLSDPRVRGR